MIIRVPESRTCFRRTGKLENRKKSGVITKSGSGLTGTDISAVTCTCRPKSPQVPLPIEIAMGDEQTTCLQRVIGFVQDAGN